MTAPRTHRSIGLAGAAALAGLLASMGGLACDRRPESNGGPRIQALPDERPPYPPVTDLPASAAAEETRAEHFVVVEGDEVLRLGRRGIPNTTDVSLDELLRAFWRLRGDPLGGRGAASPSAAPLVIAGKPVPASRVFDVVTALWQHGARLAVTGGLPGAPRQQPVRLVGEKAGAVRPAGAAVIELGPRGLVLTLPGAKPRSFESCGPAPDTGCLTVALDVAAKAGAREVRLRRVR